MDTSIHIYGHLSDGIFHHIERENTLNGNRDQDFGQPTRRIIIITATTRNNGYPCEYHYCKT